MKKTFKLLTIITAGIFTAALALLAAGAMFFYFMSLGKLVSDPLNGGVIVALSNERDVAGVMRGVCMGGQAPGTSRSPNPQVEGLIRAGKLVIVPSGTLISVRENGSLYNGFSMTTFRFRSGALSGRNGWTCPGSTALDHPYF